MILSLSHYISNAMVGPTFIILIRQDITSFIIITILPGNYQLEIIHVKLYLRWLKVGHFT